MDIFTASLAGAKDAAPPTSGKSWRMVRLSTIDGARDRYGQRTWFHRVIRLRLGLQGEAFAYQGKALLYRTSSTTSPVVVMAPEPPIYKLPTEVLELILGETGDKEEHNKQCITSKRFRYIAQGLLFKKLTVWYHNIVPVTKLFVRRKDLAKSLQSLTVVFNQTGPPALLIESFVLIEDHGQGLQWLSQVFSKNEQLRDWDDGTAKVLLRRWRK
ncbi:hypothetical protein SLS58_006107 [Diplodia intermedia]|uniref:F-box domain-containing protein n=1 Tax=Diplodia intermedia TaxID=856260 RepID=A0ABR3TP06_9PEZI